jgi:hypothetical protein
VFSLDDPLFARTERDAMQLVEIMAELYKAESDTTLFVASWIKEIDILPHRAPRKRWEDLLEKLAKGRQLRACVQAAYDANKDIQPAKFLKGLLGRTFDLGDDDEAADFDSGEYLHLFDRSSERTLLQVGLARLAGPLFAPIVIGILAERADEYDYFLRRARGGPLERFLGSTGASQYGDRIEWSDNRIDAELEIRNIAEKKSVDGYRMEDGALEQLDKVIARLGPALGSRTATLELSAKGLAQETMWAKLKEFIGYWQNFAAQQRPPVLYVVVIRYDDADPSLVELESKLAQAFVAAGCTLKPFTLSECELTHFALWRDDITKLGHTFYDSKYDKFVKLFKARFRVAEVKERLQKQGRIYI